MADGANTPTRRRARYATDADDAHQQDKRALPDLSDPNSNQRRDRPRVAFTGEEFGFGYDALGQLLKVSRRRMVSDGGAWAVKARNEREFTAYAKRLESGENNKFDFTQEVRQPLGTKEQALAAVKTHTADFAVVPFYHPFAGYDFETLRTIGGLGFLLGVEQLDVEEKLCLAVHESQVLDLAQSSHPGSAQSYLQRHYRQSWDGNARSSASIRAGIPVDDADKKLLRDRLDAVYAGPEAARRCKSKLDGLRAIGVGVQEIARMVEPHRELARLARSTVSTNRQVSTFFDPKAGVPNFVSTMGAEAQSSTLYGMVLPRVVAESSSEYIVIDENFEDGASQKTRFMVVEYNIDHTLIEDAYRTTDARTRYWYRRLSGVARAVNSAETAVMRGAGAVVLAAGLVALGAGALGATDLKSAFLTAEITKWLPPVQAQMAVAAGAIAAFIGWLFLQAQAGAKNGVRVMLRIARNKSAASTGDIENFLRNHGVRHAVVRTDEDSEGHEPAPIVLDVEFTPEDFGYSPFSILAGRRMQNSVVNGALKKAFARWKNRGVTVLAAMPIEGAYQLPAPKARRWWSEAVSAWLGDFAETMFIRLTRILAYVLPLALLGFTIWAWMTGKIG